MGTIQDILACHSARIPIIWIKTFEFERVIGDFSRLFINIQSFHNPEVWEWSLTSSKGSPGWNRKAARNSEKEIFQPDRSFQANLPLAIRDFTDKVRVPEEEIESGNTPNQIVAIIKDAHFFLDDPRVIQSLRDAFYVLASNSQSSIILLSHKENLAEELKIDHKFIELSLPNEEEIRISLQVILNDNSIEVTKEEMALTVDACKGLSANEIENSVALYKSTTGSTKINVDFFNKEKVKAVNQVPGLTYIGNVPQMNDVGGLDLLKAWIKEREEGFSNEALSFGLPTPKGILAIGMSGCGKSLVAKAISSALKSPLIQFNPHNVKGGIVGETERNLRKVFQTAEAIGRSVWWIDELEKSVAHKAGQNLDGGASDAVLQGILNWAQERTGKTFLVMTANDVSALPPEVLRKGRLDNIFFVDLPVEEEREEIIKIHLRKIKRSLSSEAVKKIAQASRGYSGAELEAGVIAGLWKAFSDGKRNLTEEDIIFSINQDIPLSITMKEQMATLRKWVETRARPASSKKEIEEVTSNGKRRKATSLDELN